MEALKIIITLALIITYIIRKVQAFAEAQQRKSLSAPTRPTVQAAQPKTSTLQKKYAQIIKEEKELRTTNMMQEEGNTLEEMGLEFEFEGRRNTANTDIISFTQNTHKKHSKKLKILSGFRFNAKHALIYDAIMNRKDF